MNTQRFSHFVAIDWSGAKGDRQKGIALALAHRDGGAPVLIEHRWGRADVHEILRDELPDNTLVGLDLGIALPFADCGAYFPGLPDSPPDAPGLWAMIDRIAADEDHLGANSFVAHPQLRPFFRDGHPWSGLDPRRLTLSSAKPRYAGRGRFTHPTPATAGTEGGVA